MNPTDLRGILRYIPSFRDKVFVIAVDGAVVDHENFANILLDVAVLRSLNINVVLVHGASAQIQQLAKECGVSPSDLDGEGVTDSATLSLAIPAAHQITHRILETLASNDLRGAHTNAIVAYPRGIIKGVQHEFTGKVERIDSALIQSLLAQGAIPVVQPLGFDGDGRTYRLNSDHVAVELAVCLKAVKLIYITALDGIIRDGELVHQLQVGELDGILASGESGLHSEVKSKARYASQACHAGVPRVHVINGLMDEGLLAEVFSNEGVGSLIYANDYQQIRQARKKDVRSIHNFTRRAVGREELVRRTQASIERSISDYFLFEMDGNPVACVALHVWPDRKVGEVYSLCVSPPHENQGIGRKLIRFLEAKGRELGLESLFLLSTQAYTYFQTKLGFKEGSPSILPSERLARYEKSARKSLVLVKLLKEGG